MPNQTGPTTPQGKHNSSLNHLQHGATSKSLLLPNEDPADYMRLLESAFAQYEPATENDAGIVAQCIHTQWLLLRRQRAADFVEVDLYARNPEPTNWSAEDFATMNRLDRYKTEAARSHARSLKNLQTVQKMNRDDQRWRLYLETTKQKLKLQLERFSMTKEKQETQKSRAAEREAVKAKEEQHAYHLDPDPITTYRARVPFNLQTLYIGYERGITKHYETSPTNEQMLDRLSESDNVIRQYNFVGGVPPEYKRLITAKAFRHGASTADQKTYTFAEWKELIAKE